jgi:hypothetical protein
VAELDPSLYELNAKHFIDGNISDDQDARRRSRSIADALTQAMGTLLIAVTAKAADHVYNLGPSEGVATVPVAEVLAKVGGNVPPVTP